MILTEKRFRLAPMSPVILILTLILLVIPACSLAAAVLRHRLMGAAGILATAIYAWVWLRFRPTEFVVRPTTLDIVWPLKRRQLRRDGIASVRLVDRSALHAETGWGMRVGAGGLWGGFGWLWTQRRGIVQMYISRTDNLVWIERVDGRPWLITPQQPEAFVRALKTSLSVLVGVLLATAPATAGTIGFQRIAVADSDGKPREVGIWYPRDGPDLMQPLGPYRHTVAVDGPMVGGQSAGMLRSSTAGPSTRSSISSWSPSSRHICPAPDPQREGDRR